MLIELKNLSKTYPGPKGTGTPALRGVDLRIEEGEMVAVTGTSGAGKSTLLHILAGLLKFDSGEYRFRGESVAEFSAARNSRMRNREVGIVLQNFGLIEEYSVLLNTMIPMYFSPGKRDRKTAALSALEKVGIADLKNKTPRMISGGEKQRCAIARAVVNNPLLLLADEPTGQLDSGTAKEVMALFRELNRSGVTVLIVTHDSNIAGCCDRILTMSDGEIVSDTGHVG